MRNLLIAICVTVGILFTAILIVGQTKNNTSALDLNGITPIQSAPQGQQNQIQQVITPTPEVAGVIDQPKATISATIKTSKGNIVLTLYAQDAPNTVDNFVRKAVSGYYNNLIFHRVEDWVLQGGDPKGDGTGGGDMRTEINDKPFVTGSLGIARGPNIQISNDSQFFITKSDAEWLNSQYTNFGMVTEGMDVVNKMKIGDKILSITIDN